MPIIEKSRQSNGSMPGGGRTTANAGPTNTNIKSAQPGERGAQIEHLLPSNSIHTFLFTFILTYCSFFALFHHFHFALIFHYFMLFFCASIGLPSLCFLSNTFRYKISSFNHSIHIFFHFFCLQSFPYLIKFYQTFI
jgi:hypothetical protein